jgi:hypothetical protein
MIAVLAGVLLALAWAFGPFGRRRVLALSAGSA